MKKFNYPIIFIVLLTIIVTLTNSLTFNANTGDDVFDKKLNEINISASLNINQFIDRVSSLYFVDKVILNDMLVTMEPVDVLITLHVSKITDFSMYEVLSSYKNNSKKGWNSVLHELGINNTSYEFKQIKNIVKYNDESFINSSLSQNKN
jgi:hypothetical protein